MTSLRIVGECNAGERASKGLYEPAGRERFKLTVPYPPSGNHRLGMRGGMFFRTAAYKKWIREVCAIVKAEKAKPITYGRLGMQVMFSPATRRPHDQDNRIKTLCDGLVAAGLITDDRIDYIVSTREWDSKFGEAEVEVWRLQ